jgi:large subunit ribosomal protein L25
MVLIDLNVTSRETGKKALSALRNSGKVPGVFYLKGEESISIAATPKDLKGIVYTAETKIINLVIDEKESRECILREVKFHPVTDAIVHYDLLGIVRGQLINVEVPVAVIGYKPVGVIEGGLMQQVLHRMPIRCLPKNIPNSIEVDCSALRIGDTLLVRDVNVENIEITIPESSAVVSIVQSRVSKADLGEEEDVIEGEGDEADESAE